jgi:hypothetical protein
MPMRESAEGQPSQIVQTSPGINEYQIRLGLRSRLVQQYGQRGTLGARRHKGLGEIMKIQTPQFF